ncbi:hypothetical protein Taro_008530 [Colocasia esculenta]|uniref:Uncharacterized protein n=1 Tax=Colocasia esculenta TaxID=4460 RepID=A0A843TYH4_COLES|nr:hypothetical protein [Colocasia esculenta]
MFETILLLLLSLTICCGWVAARLALPFHALILIEAEKDQNINNRGGWGILALHTGYWSGSIRKQGSQGSGSCYLIEPCQYHNLALMVLQLSIRQGVLLVSQTWIRRDLFVY